MTEPLTVQVSQRKTFELLRPKKVVNLTKQDAASFGQRGTHGGSYGINLNDERRCVGLP